MAGLTPACTALLVMAVGGALAAEPPPGLMPLRLDPGPADPAPTLLRGRHLIWTWASDVSQALTVEAEPVKLGSYVSGLELAYPADSTPTAIARAELGERAVLRFQPGSSGAVAFSADAGSNAYRLLKGPAHLALEASPDRPLHLLGAGELWFFVPHGARAFTVAVRGQGEGETARVTLFDPNGGEVADAEALKGLTARLATTVGDGAGQIWRIAVSKASEGVLEDVFLSLEGDVPPFVSLSPTGGLVPFCYGLNPQPRLVTALRDAILQVGLISPDLAASHTLAVRLEREGKSVSQARTQPGQNVLDLALPSLSDASYLAVAELLDAGGEVVAQTSGAVEVRNRVRYGGGLNPLLDLSASFPTSPTQPVEATVSLALEGLDDDTVTLSAALYRCGISDDPTGPAALKIAEDPVLPRSGDVWQARSPTPLPDGTYEWLFTVRAPDCPWPLFWQRVHWVVYRDQLFPELGSQATSPPPCCLLWGLEPLVVAVPEVQDAVPCSYMVSAPEMTRPLTTAAALGESRSATALVIARKNLPRVSARVSDLIGPGRSCLPAAAVDLGIARYWAQRTSWRSSNCWVVPELLERRTAWAMSELQPTILWLTINVPQTAVPGLYRGRLLLTADGRTIDKPLELRVYPFRLADPGEYHWGLYTDSSRWRRYSPAKVEAEMRDYVAHGITSLMMYPPSHSEVALEDGRLTVEATQFQRYMDLALRCGLRAPTVLSFQSLPGQVNRLVDAAADGQDKWDAVYRDIALAFDRLASEGGWGEVVYHAIDEPRGDETAKAAIHQLSILKKAGLTTFTTALDPVLINGPLDPYLDVRCWSVGYVLGSKPANERARTDCASSGDRLWYYGSGSYTGQEGSMLPNRWIVGCGLWISGAEGAWSWTFLRPKDDAFNDFDGEAQREAKDAMIVYPSEGDCPPLATTQWEGLRAGVNDFRYLYTARLAAQSRGDTEGLQALARLTDEMPWGVRPPGVDSATLDRWRTRAARLIGRGP